MTNRPIKILIADDEPDVVEFLSYNLSKENFEVIKSYQGWQAVFLAIRKRPDLIIMDVHMPQLSGIEACRIIKQNRELENTPVLFLTGDSDEYISMSAMRAGGDHFINKPIHPSIILEMINGMLEGKEILSK